MVGRTQQKMIISCAIVILAVASTSKAQFFEKGALSPQGLSSRTQMVNDFYDLGRGAGMPGSTLNPMNWPTQMNAMGRIANSSMNSMQTGLRQSADGLQKMQNVGNQMANMVPGMHQQQAGTQPQQPFSYAQPNRNPTQFGSQLPTFASAPLNFNNMMSPPPFVPNSTSANPINSNIAGQGYGMGSNLLNGVKRVGQSIYNAIAAPAPKSRMPTFSPPMPFNNQLQQQPSMMGGSSFPTQMQVPSQTQPQPPTMNGIVSPAGLQQPQPGNFGQMTQQQPPVMNGVNPSIGSFGMQQPANFNMENVGNSPFGNMPQQLPTSEDADVMFERAMDPTRLA